MEENKNKVNNAVNDAEDYDFIADANATINGLFNRLDIKNDDDEKRVLITMAADYATGDTLFIAHGKKSFIAVTLAMYMRRNKIEREVKRALELIDEGVIKVLEEEEIS